MVSSAMLVRCFFFFNCLDRAERVSVGYEFRSFLHIGMTDESCLNTRGGECSRLCETARRSFLVRVRDPVNF